MPARESSCRIRQIDENDDLGLDRLQATDRADKLACFGLNVHSLRRNAEQAREKPESKPIAFA